MKIQYFETKKIKNNIETFCLLLIILFMIKTHSNSKKDNKHMDIIYLERGLLRTWRKVNINEIEQIHFLDNDDYRYISIQEMQRCNIKMNNKWHMCLILKDTARGIITGNYRKEVIKWRI